MTEAQRRFVALERERKRFQEDFEEAFQAVTQEVGPGGYFQDDQKIVYKITVPEGRWVKYEAVSYVRTKRGDEERGTLSAKEAREAGFEV